jgi:SAM-dependent methyltransferase
MTRCDTCAAEGAYLWELKGHHFYKCRQCGLRYINVNENDIANLYEYDYYKTLYPDYESDRNIHRLNSDIILSEIDRYFETGRLLEIGSAFGFFLSRAAQRGWNTTGYEVSEYACRIAHDKYRCNVINSDFLTASINNNSFDMCCLLDTIEHLLHPSLFIDKISRILRPGGGIIITTGDIKSLTAKLFGKKWRLMTPPYHIHYFSPKSLTVLLEKYGFTVISIRHRIKYQNLGSMLQYFFSLSKSRIVRLPVPTYLGDVMTVIARKR